MTCKRGFTLIEIVAVVIIGTLAAISIPTYNNMVFNAQAQNTMNNAQFIMAAQQVYYFNNGKYCVWNPPQYVWEFDT